MVQRVWGQIESVGLQDSTVIATSKMQRDMIHSQVGQDVPLVIEPERRDTFPAIALAATYLYTYSNVSLDETVVILPVDPYVDDAFFQKVKEIENVLETSQAELGLIGVEPTYPSSKYGYIVPKGSRSKEISYLEVSHFTEKPTEEEAEKLIEIKCLMELRCFCI